MIINVEDFHLELEIEPDFENSGYKVRCRLPEVCEKWTEWETLLRKMKFKISGLSGALRGLRGSA